MTGAALVAVQSRSRFGVGGRLALGFGVVCLLIVAMAATAIWQAGRMQQQFAHALDNRVTVLTQLQSLSSEVSAVSLAARDAILATDPAVAQAALERLENGRGRIGDAIERLQQQFGAENKALAEELGNQSSSVLVVLLKLTRLQRAQQSDAARALLFSALQPKMDAFAKGIDKAQSTELQGLADTRAQSVVHSAVARGILGAMALAALAISGVMAWRITRSITRPVVHTVRVAEAIAAGDLTASLNVERDDELGRLQVAVLAMQRQLHELVGGICRLADQLANASGEIADGSLHLSQRTEETAASLQQTAGAIERLCDTVRDSGDAARSANEMVSNTASTAQRGGAAVQQVVQRMGEIAAASTRIADITGVIDGIAFQTNILALNAAVEAARAGAHGKGFAVVASEVRALAQRSTQAAREIKDLIGASTQTVQSGERLVKDAGATMTEIVDGVARATSMVDQICKATLSQSEGLGDVNQSVTRLDQMTQQNAALVEQSAASAEELRAQARELQALVKRFKLTDESTLEAA
jgi:methyl-accepting chemotaxis protein